MLVLLNANRINYAALLASRRAIVHFTLVSQKKLNFISLKNKISTGSKILDMYVKMIKM